MIRRFVQSVAVYQAMTAEQRQATDFFIWIGWAAGVLGAGGCAALIWSGLRPW